MALIEYRIIVDAAGNARIVQDVREIDKHDVIRFVSDGPNPKHTFIKFENATPTDSIPPKKLHQIPKKGDPHQPHNVDHPNKGKAPKFDYSTLPPDPCDPLAGTPAKRDAYHFRCGSTDDDTANGNFTDWGGGQGGNNPGGGSC